MQSILRAFLFAIADGPPYHAMRRRFTTKRDELIDQIALVLQTETSDFGRIDSNAASKI